MNQLSEWVDKFADHLYSWASYKVSDDELAKDLVQETFLAAAKGFDKFQNKSNPKTWLTSILNNKISDHYRKAFRRQEVTGTSFTENTGEFEGRYFDETDSWKTGKSPMIWDNADLNLLDDPEFNLILQDCIDDLPGKWSFAISMKYIEGKDGNEICQDLDVTPTNFWQIIRRAKLKLRECLEYNWFKN